MKIKNFDVLAITPLRKAALSIAEAGLEAIDTGKVVKDAVRKDGDNLFVKGEQFSLSGAENVVVVAVGKCAYAAAAELENILGERITKGVAIDVKAGAPLKRIAVYEGTHPAPSDKNVKAAKAVAETLGGLTGKDLVIFIISGGGSALLCLPAVAKAVAGKPAGATLAYRSAGEVGVKEDLPTQQAGPDGVENEAKIFRSLTAAGATIQEINIVRKHHSLARGGWLAKYAYPAQVVSLIFSDVPSSSAAGLGGPGNDFQFIASGPTVKDATTVRDAGEVLSKYHVLETCGIKDCGLVETPKENKYFARTRNIPALSNETALNAMAAMAKELGFSAEIRAAALTGEARDVGAKIIRDLRAAPPKSVLLYGGETTVTIRGKGRGGRNLELALAGLKEIGDGELVVSVASDGRDNSDFAGAICDTITKEAIRKAGFDAETELKNNNSYPVFEKAGNYLLTGDTGSNVSDLIIALEA